MKEKLGHWEGNLAGSPDMPQGRLFVEIPTTVSIHHHLKYPSNIFDFYEYFVFHLSGIVVVLVLGEGSCLCLTLSKCLINTLLKPHHR